jgi:hypothetical protein
VGQGDAVQPPCPRSAARRGHLGADSFAGLLVAQIGPVEELQDLDLVFREPLNAAEIGVNPFLSRSKKIN